MKLSSKAQFKLSEEAALWLVRLQEDPSTQRRAEFFDWVRQSPRHMEEFMFSKAVSTQLKDMDPQREIGIDMQALAALDDGNIAALEHTAEGTDIETRAPLPSLTAAGPSHGLSSGRKWGWISGIAASAAALLFGGMLLKSALDAEQTYATATGDQQSIKLRDGSLMQLNTHSRAEVRFSENVRQVRLLEGEALFVVEHDPARPFRVEAGGAMIQAIGTQFNVYRRSEGTRVSVIEGAVQISRPRAESIRLAAGAEADIAAGQVVKTAQPDIQRAVAWRTRRLVFHGDRLKDVAHEFNRYNRRQIRLEGAAVGERRISGVFDADDTRPLIEFLTQRPDFSVTQSAPEIVIGLSD